MHQDRIDAIIPAFESLPGAVAFQGRLSWALEEDALGPLLMPEDFAAIARRIHQLSEAALAAGGGWGLSNAGFVTSEDTGVATVHPFTAFKARLRDLELHDDTGDEYDDGYMAALRDVRAAVAEVEA